MYKGILKTQEQHLSVYKYKEQKTTKISCDHCTGIKSGCTLQFVYDQTAIRAPIPAPSAAIYWWNAT